MNEPTENVCRSCGFTTHFDECTTDQQIQRFKTARQNRTGSAPDCHIAHIQRAKRKGGRSQCIAEFANQKAQSLFLAGNLMHRNLRVTLKAKFRN